MKIGERLANVPLVRQFFGLPSTAGDSSFVEYYGGADPRTFGLYNRYHGIVYRSIKLVARSTAKGEWDVTKPTKSHDLLRAKVENHPFLELLDNPHEGFTRFDLLYGSIAFKLMAGEWFWYFAMGSNSRKPMEVYLLHPKQVTVVIDKTTREVVGYKYQVAAGNQIPLDKDEVWHHHEFNPNNPYRGLGTLQASLTYVDTEQHSSRFTKNFFKNSGTPTGIVTVDTRNKDEFRKFKRKWQEQYGGVDNAGKLAFLRAQEVKFNKLSLGLSEIDMKALRDMSKEDVAMMFGVPMPLLSKSDQNGLGRSNIEALEYVFTKYTIDDELTELDNSFQQIINRYWPAENVEIEHRNIIPENAEQQLKDEAAGIGKWYTRNEVRARRGLAPRTGGDSLYHAANEVEIDGSDTEARSSKSAGVKRVKLTLAQHKKKDTEPEVNERFRVQLMTLQENYEKTVKKKIGKFLDDQKERVLAIVEPKKSFGTLFAVEEEQKVMTETVAPLVVSLAEESGKIALDFAGATDMDFDFTQALLDAINNSVSRMSERYNKDTLEELAASLGQGTADGESISKLKKRVEQIYEDAKGYRAERVARYETLKGSNAATEYAYRQTGYVMAKRWFTNFGACQYCRELDGKTVKLGVSFYEIGQSVSGDDGGEYAVDYDTIEHPPLHPNCRCTIVPVIDQED